MVIPAHNAEKFIKRAVQSIENQSFEDWELIIVENGSSDGTYSFCKQFLIDSRIRLVSSETGVSNARNKGIELSNGRWICFLDADDYLLNDALNLFIKEAKDDIDLIVGEYDHNKIASVAPAVISNSEFLELSLCNPTQYCNVTGCLFSNAMIRRLNLCFKRELTHAEDSVFLIEFIVAGARVKLLNHALYHVYYNPDSAVRAGSTSNVEAYANSINTIKGILTVYQYNIEPALDAFILNQVLILMVHDIYAGVKDLKSYKKACRKFDQMLMNKTFVESFEPEAIKKLSRKKQVCLFFLEKHCRFITFLIVRIRQVGNARKAEQEMIPKKI